MTEQYSIALIKTGIIFVIGILIYAFIYFLLFRRRGVWISKINIFFVLLLGLLGARWFVFFAYNKMVVKPLDFVAISLAVCMAFRIIDFYWVEIKIDGGDINFPSKWHSVIVKFVYGIIILASSLVVWKYNFLSWCALFGTIAVVLTITFQDLLKSLINWISWGKNFQKGSWASLGDKEGKIIESNWQGIKLEMDNNSFLFVPSQAILRGNLVSYDLSAQKHSCNIDIKVNYSIEPKKVVDLLVRLVSHTQGVIRDPAPQVFIYHIDDSYIKYRTVFYIDDYFQEKAIKSKIYSLIWYSFKREEIDIPHPSCNTYTCAVAPIDKSKEKMENIRLKMEIIKKVDILSVLPEEALKNISEKIKRQVYVKEETIVQQGQVEDKIFIILSGKIAAKSKKKGPTREMITNVLGPLQYFGEMSLFLGETSFATVTVEETSECLVLKRDELKDILVKDIELVQQICRILAEKFSNQKERLEEELEKGGSITPFEERIKNIYNKVKEVFGLL